MVCKFDTVYRKIPIYRKFRYIGMTEKLMHADKPMLVSIPIFSVYQYAVHSYTKQLKIQYNFKKYN